MSELPTLNTETIWAIVNEEIDDDTVNKLLWYHLGYRYDQASKQWDLKNVSLEWQEAYPEPPNFIESRPATVKLTRSIPQQNKQLLKTKLGFKGYKIGDFTPRQARRATAASWLLSHIQETA